MKIFIAYEPNESGKGKFIGRLIREWDRAGVEYSFKQEGCDVALGLTKWRIKIDKGMPKVLRMDGIHLKKDPRSKWRNNKARESIKKSDAVIWQSKFAKKIVMKWLKVSPKKSAIIYNGDNPAEYLDVLPMPKSDYKDVLMSAKWFSREQRKSKKLWLHLDVMTEYARINPSTPFWLAGDTGNIMPKHPNLTVLGKIKDVELKRYIKMADCLLYLAHPDWCPNQVVESIVAGTPVVCLPGSGTEELVREGGGLVCKSDDVAEIIGTLDMVLEIGEKAHKPSLWIDSVAKQYYDVIEEVCDG